MREPRTTCYVHNFDCSQMKGETDVTYYYPDLSEDAQQCKRLERRIVGLQRQIARLTAQHESLVGSVREYAELGADVDLLVLVDACENAPQEGE